MPKRILVMLCSLLTVIGTSCGVLAVEYEEVDTNIDISVIENENLAPVDFFENPDDVIGISTYTTSVPTLYWDLSSKDYNGNLVEVRAGWLYTNYYFSSNKDGKLFLDYNIQGIDTDGTKMQIGVYNKSTGKFVQYYTTSGVPTAACMQFTGLNKSQHYALAFKAVRDPLAYNGIKGTIVVSN